ncbi:hypothetical protein PIB30_043622 [Stylosanthes scabra]|uniref:Uncharacterized protein n=1 Tax=Stylosanthes scabra TaxID=79078 RepID=A0ABU6VHU4_9FABA|nr:hypothetical protein [Stylosanthes scabra]
MTKQVSMLHVADINGVSRFAAIGGNSVGPTTSAKPQSPAVDGGSERRLVIKKVGGGLQLPLLLNGHGKDSSTLWYWFSIFKFFPKCFD